MSTEFEGRGPEQAPSQPADTGGAHLEPLEGSHAEAALAAQPPNTTGPAATEVPATGDGAIDAVLAGLASAQNAPLADRIEAGERALAALQSRLNDLGGA
jgi:hypothetical protein